MDSEQEFDKLNWLTKKRIGNIFSFSLFGLKISIHYAFYTKNNYNK